MKFKTIFMLFNAVVLMAFLFVALVPFIMLGSEFSQLFWTQNWILVLLFVLFIVILDGYFILNWKLFIYLEQENWPALMGYLENKIFEKEQFKFRYMNLYVNTSLSVSNLEKIHRLELEIREKKPEMLIPMALPLGLPYLLKKDDQSAAEYFRDVLKLKGLKHKTWLQWCLAFILIGQRQVEEAVGPLLDAMKSEKHDGVLMLLILFLLDSLRIHVPSEEQDEITRHNMELKIKVQDKNTWEKMLSKSRDRNLLPTLLISLLKEARQWIVQLEG
ncbi:MAG: hypothetical protein PF447_10560 [Spirochaetaceae bacterium]|jgi:hypothetical protein|nr:hypothetical protein [Spirochaetaceae bacterium]